MRGKMPDDEREMFLARSLRFMQESLRKSGPAAAAGYTLLAAIGVLGGIGYALDAWRGTSPGFLIAGLLLGIIVGFVELARIIWHK
jgi:F0F1-type ATP synthase assembly protein I